MVTIEKDSDMDGLPDSWELNGLDIDDNGEVDLDLPMLGADWERKDVFVEVDYMSTHHPNQDALNDVIQAFANAPVTNPDGTKGITLHVIVDEEVPFTEVLPSWDAFYTIKAASFGSAAERADPKTIEAKKKVFRYCLSAHKTGFTTSELCLGVAEGIPSDDFILTFGAFPDQLGSRNDQASTFMHELGHCLGLYHGGYQDVNNKPNYLSVMNYLFEFSTRGLDYSRGLCGDFVLSEPNLNERNGIGILQQTRWFGPNGTLYQNDGTRLAINWNANNVIEESVAVNLNYNPEKPYRDDKSSNQWYTDFNDWENLAYRFRGTKLSAESTTPMDYHTELTVDEIEQMREAEKNMIVVSTPESAGAEELDVVVSALGTFLRTEPFQGSPSGGSAVKDAAIVDLTGKGFKEGDNIIISYSGTIYLSAYWSPNDLGSFVDVKNLPLLGLFSTTNALDSIDKLNRVPGAIDCGKDYKTEKTYFKSYDTDIQEDFRIEPNTGFEIQIPNNAKYLFLCISDAFYPDNVGSFRVSIRLSEPSTFPLEVIVVIAIALSAILVIFFLLKRRRKPASAQTKKATQTTEKIT